MSSKALGGCLPGLIVLFQQMLSEHLLGIGGGTGEVEGWPLSVYFYTKQGWKSRGAQKFFVMEDNADHMPVFVITVGTRHLP